MSYRDFLDKLDCLKTLIEQKRTGTADDLAKKLCLSRRTLFNYFDLLKDEGCSIKFCRYRHTYYFNDSAEK